MKIDDLTGIDWDAFATTGEWTKALNDLLGLADAAAAAGRRDELADALDAFADHSASDDLDVITRLDGVARKAARALRLADIAASVAELQIASGDFRTIVKEFSAASAALRKEAATLRAERLTAAVSSLTETISSLKALEQAVKGDQDQEVALAISRLVANAQSLRSRLERPT